MRRLLILLVALAAASVLLSQAEAAQQPGDVVPGRYIVVLEPAASPVAVAADHGLARVRTYQAALNGFAAIIPAQALSGIARDPRVAFVEPDRAYTVADQTIPTGIDRIEADKIHTSMGQPVTVDKDVAIIDTGINSHDDLILAGGINLVGGPAANYNDGYGHGTHVAGTVGALDNGLGVVGVAPGASVWAVKVCNNGGICLSSNMIAGLEWVAERKLEAHDGDDDPGIDFAAANMSLGTSEDAELCTSATGDSLHLAVCGLVDSGVPLALAAGNESAEKRAYPEAIAVSAIADFDGKGGGAAAPTCRSDGDDTLADFSNYGPEVDIAAPGVCILSTSSGGGYALGSGTSMAAPHVAGAIALYLEANGLAPAGDRSGAEAIRAAIIGAALPQGDPCGYTNEHASQGSDEPLLFVNASAFGGDDTCDVAEQLDHDVAVTAVSAPSSVTVGDTVPIDVTVENQGASEETFDVTLTDTTDNFLIGDQSVTLAVGEAKTITFSWDTTGVALGDHVLQAEAVLSMSTDEDPADNTKTALVAVEEPGESEKCPPGWERKGWC